MGGKGLLPAMEAADVVAFDLFDTLIARSLVYPKDVFLYLEESSHAPGFAEARVRAERAAREELGREIRYDEIYERIDPRYRFLRDRELSVEESICWADPDAKEAFDAAVEMGKRVAVVSDMYFSEDTLARFLDRCGYRGYGRLYTSSSEGRKKKDGTLYPLILEEEGVGPGRLLMIGDDAHADVSVPRSLGIRACRWTPVRERYAEGHRREVRFYEKNRSAAASAIVGMDIRHWAETGGKEGYWHSVAWRFGGPMAVAFAKFVERNTPDDVERLLFLSRDSYAPMRVYEEICDAKDHVYYHTSRMLSKAFGDRDMSKRDVRESVTAYLRMNGREVPEDGTGKVVEDGHERCARYLRSCVGGAEKVMIVDSTTMRFTSQRSIERELGRKVLGCYYAVTAPSDEDYVVYADRAREHLCSTRVNLAEFFFGSGEGELADIDDEGNPVTYDDPADASRRRHFSEVFGSEMECARLYRDVYGEDIPDIPSPIMDAWVGVLVSYEKGNDPDTLSGMMWAVNTQHTVRRHLILRASEIPSAVVMAVADRLRK